MMDLEFTVQLVYMGGDGAVDTTHAFGMTRNQIPL